MFVQNTCLAETAIASILQYLNFYTSTQDIENKE